MPRPPHPESVDDQPHQILDGILQLRVEDQMSVDEIVERGYERSVVCDVVSMIQRTEYKRRQAPPGLKVSHRAFGTGRRIPIAMRLDLPQPGGGEALRPARADRAAVV